MNERIEGLLKIVRESFIDINNTLNEIRTTFVFKDFGDNLPTIEQYGDEHSICLLYDEVKELPIEYASAMMDKIGFISPVCFNPIVYNKIMNCEYDAKDVANLQLIFKNTIFK